MLLRWEFFYLHLISLQALLNFSHYYMTRPAIYSRFKVWYKSWLYLVSVSFLVLAFTFKQIPKVNCLIASLCIKCIWWVINEYHRGNGKGSDGWCAGSKNINTFFRELRKEYQARESVKLSIEDTLDSLPEEPFDKDLYQKKCNVVFQHVYESYYGQGQSLYSWLLKFESRLEDRTLVMKGYETTHTRILTC